MITAFGMNWNVQRSKVEVYVKVGDQFVGMANTVDKLVKLICKHGVIEDIRDVRPIWRDMYRDDLCQIFDKMVDEALKLHAFVELTQRIEFQETDEAFLAQDYDDDVAAYDAARGIV